MAGLIPQNFIDDLLDRTDITELIDGRVKLKKTGKNYSACCPFHDEKTPSFTVSPEKQFYHCFGCGASGNAVGFLMEYDRVGFVEAVEQLAHRAGMQVPKQARDPHQEQRERTRNSIYTLLEKVGTFYQQQLRQHTTREQAVNYLKGRGLDGHIARDFGIGYAPPGWDNLLQELGEKPEQRQLLIDSGMLVDRKGEKGEKDKLYDRFRYRIQFPIRDIRGRIIGFGGRVLGDDKPKYLNSPETPVFSKGRELYGLYEARQFYRQLPRLLVVEGYMDVVSLAQYGIRYSVATLGTACGEEHLNRAFRHTSEVVFCFDGDNAGRAAASRALENSLPAMSDGRQVKFLFLPDGEDPDTLVRQVGTEKFENMVDLAVPLEDFLFDACANGIDAQSLEGRARISKLAAPMIDKLPSGIFKELMFDKLAQRTGINRATLDDIIVQTEPEKPSLPQSSQPVDNAPSQSPQVPNEQISYAPQEQTSDYPDDHYDSAPEYYNDSAGYHDYEQLPDSPNTIHPLHSGQGSYLIPPARKAISLLLSEPALAAECSEYRELYQSWSDSGNSDLKLLSHLLKLLEQRPHYKLSHLISYWRGAYGEAEMQLISDIAGADLVQATLRMNKSQPQSDTAETTKNYDLSTALLETMARLKKIESEDRSRASIDKLKQSDFSSLSSEERRQLVEQALLNKKRH